MDPLTIRTGKGAFGAPALGLWFDAREPVRHPERVFISHAHSDHLAEHDEAICSPPTAELISNRVGGRLRAQPLQLEAAYSFSGPGADFRITLLPAGHILGSAMAYVEAGSQSLLYTGDFKLRPGMAAEPCQPRPAVSLVMESTYGLPHYRFPPTEEVLQGIIRFCREALRNGESPVLLGYSLGKSQALLRGLQEADLPVALHPQAYRLTQTYERLGWAFPPYHCFQPEASPAGAEVVLYPPTADRAPLAHHRGPIRTAVLTGRALDSSCRFRAQTDAAFPLSDHADFAELLELVRQVNPQKVFTVHGSALELAGILREMGYEAEALGSPTEQLSLPLSGMGEPRKRPSPVRQSPPSHPGRSEASSSPAPPATFRAFAETGEQVEGVSGKRDKVALIADYLQRLQDADLPHVVTWLSGSPFPAHQRKALRLGGAIIRDAVCGVIHLDRAGFQQTYLKHSDLGETAAELLAEQSGEGPPLKISEVVDLFEQLQATQSPTLKARVLQAGLQRCLPREARFLIKILAGELRIGLREGLLEEAIARAFHADLPAVQRAGMLLADPGETALKSRHGLLDQVGLVPFRPFKFMLASPEPSAERLWRRFRPHRRSPRSMQGADTPPPPDPSPVEIGIEDKYDGVRCQLHKVGREVALYSRDLREITRTFYEIADAARQLPDDSVLDGEVVAMDGERILPFSELQKRLGREIDDLFLQEEVPIRFVAFDLLWWNGQTCMEWPLRERRRGLEALSLGPPFRLAAAAIARSVDELDHAFQTARERGNEGIMAKDLESRYTPGRRGLAWLKWKRPAATLDCIVVGAEYGHGKRKGVLSDYTFAVRDEESGQLKTIGKAYSGLTDREIERLTRHFQSRAIRQEGRFIEVEPDTVLEIAFDTLQRSRRHGSGLAMRFPRIERIRPDKSPQQIDTLAAARKLARK